MTLRSDLRMYSPISHRSDPCRNFILYENPELASISRSLVSSIAESGENGNYRSLQVCLIGLMGLASERGWNTCWGRMRMDQLLGEDENGGLDGEYLCT